jgi:ribosome-binding factor A
MATTRRQQQVAEQIQEELGDLFQRHISDPRLNFVSITQVDVTPDLQLARIYISHLSDASETPQIMKALHHATGYLRRELARRLSLRLVPELRFEYDASLERARRIDALLDGLEPSTSETTQAPIDAAADEADDEAEQDASS